MYMCEYTTMIKKITAIYSKKKRNTICQVFIDASLGVVSSL